MTLNEQIECVRRQIRQERLVRDTLLSPGRMAESDHQLACMQAVITTLTIDYPRALERVAELKRALEVYEEEARRRSIQKER